MGAGCASGPAPLGPSRAWHHRALGLYKRMLSFTCTAPGGATLLLPPLLPAASLPERISVLDLHALKLCLTPPPKTRSTRGGSPPRKAHMYVHLEVSTGILIQS